jgi:hypothetical protein
MIDFIADIDVSSLIFKYSMKKAVLFGHVRREVNGSDLSQKPFGAAIDFFIIEYIRHRENSPQNANEVMAQSAKA